MRSSSHPDSRKGPADSAKAENQPGHSGSGTADLYVVGLGPGSLELMSLRARQVIEQVQAVVGYSTYVELIRPLLSGKQVVATGMRREVERTNRAIELACQGTGCALVCSGDPGIYAMAGLVLEICRRRNLDVRLVNQSPPDVRPGPETLLVEIVPGIPALAAGAALLGAPLMHDFAAISLSDLLTPWNVIEKRLDAAAAADFVIVLYNPKSRRRQDQLERACRIMARHRPENTPAGVVTSAGRPEQTVLLTTLGRLSLAPAGMQTTIFVGNSTTTSWGDILLTPRGYAAKYDLGPK